MSKPKALIFSLLLLPFLLLGFQYPKSLKGTWSLVKFYDAGNKQTIHKPKDSQSIAPFIVFDSDAYSGKATGRTTFNKFSVDYVQDSAQ